LDCGGEAASHLGDTCNVEGSELALPCVIKVAGSSDDITLAIQFGESIGLDFFHKEASDTVSLDSALPSIGVGDHALVELRFKGGGG